MMTLGNMINLLKMFNPEERIRYDFGYFVPTYFMSWRGDYSHLALGYQEYKDVFVKDLLGLCCQANGMTFEGYKGGNYKMNLNTPIWIANQGFSGNTIPETIIQSSIGTIIQTRFEQY